MELTAEQLAQYDRDGFLLFPDLISADEVSALKEELRRLAPTQTDHIVREKSGALRTIFRVHDAESPTASPAFHSLARLPRLLRPAQQVLRDEALYVYHSKCNLKEAIEGAVWQWHQDYGYWKFDGVETAELTTFLVMLNPATEMGGCLYFIPGSHKLGRIEPEVDEKTTSYKLWTVPKDRLIEIMQEHGEPVALTGGPGTGVIFHPNLIHGSGHNMSPISRWHIYTVYNRVANAPRNVENPRPEYVVSRDYRPLQLVDDKAILGVPAAAE